MKEKVSAIRFIGAELAFWALSIFGGAVPMLINLLQPRFARWMPGDLGYEILRLVANAIGSLLAIYAMRYITLYSAPVFCLVNCVIALVLCVVMLFLCFITGVLTWSYLICYVLMIAAYVYGCSIFAKELRAR